MWAYEVVEEERKGGVFHVDAAFHGVDWLVVAG
jgi:hypothetical protein